MIELMSRFQPNCQNESPVTADNCDDENGMTMIP